jgi:hypothetical protein
MSLPNNYVIEGVLDSDVEVGKMVQGIRTKRNGVEIPGYFHTSVIQKIDGDILETLNSKYKIEQI